MHENTPIVGGPAKGTGGGEGISCYFVVVHDTNQNRDMFDVGDLNPLTAVAVVEANSSPPPPLPSHGLATRPNRSNCLDREQVLK